MPSNDFYALDLTYGTVIEYILEKLGITENEIREAVRKSIREHEIKEAKALLKRLEESK